MHSLITEGNKLLIILQPPMDGKKSFLGLLEN